MQKKKPLLLYTTRKGFERFEQKQTFCSISDPTETYSTSINPIQLRASKLCTVQHGWYLFLNYIASNLSEFFLWHPYYHNKITLPSFNQNGISIAYFILTPPLTQNPNGQPCSIFLFPSLSTSIFYLHLGDKQWTQVNFHDDVVRALAIIGRRETPPQIKNCFADPVYCNGCLYATLSVATDLVQIKIQKPNGLLKMNSTLFPMPKNSRLLCNSQWHKNWMLESNNQIFRIQILKAHDRIIAVSVYRFDSSQTMWKKVKSIKDRMIFVSSLDSSFSCQPINPETEGGRIYIALDDNDFVYIYNIEDDSLMISQSFPNLPKNRSKSRWIMPNICITDTLKEENAKALQIREKENAKALQVREKENMCGVPSFFYHIFNLIFKKKKKKENMSGAIHLKKTDDKFAFPIDIVDAEDTFALPIDIVEVIAKHTVDVEDKFALPINIVDVEDKLALPIEIVEVIAKHIVNVVDYLHFRATNRLFHLIAPPLQWCSSSMSRFDDLSLSPLLVFSENKDEMLTFVHPKHGFKYKYNIKYPYGEFWNLMTDWEICCSKDGWILIVGETSNGCFFFNPFTKQVLSPSLRFSNWNTLCVGLSHPPTSSECVIISLEKFKSCSSMMAFTYIPSERFWGWDMVTFENIEFPLYNISPALHNGLFYYLSIEGKLAVIEATRGEEPKWKELVEPQAPCTGFFDSFLVECNGSLLSVFECCYRKWVKVFKLNESTMRWIKVESLNDHMLFVGNHTSFSAVAKIPGMENKIYFARFYDESIVFYCLETNKYHTFENEDVHFHHVKEHLNSCWIDPRWD